MHKFYWHNNSHAGNGGGSEGGGRGGGGNGSNRARPAGSSHGSSQPAVAGAAAASQSQRAARGGNSSSSVAMRMGDAAARTAGAVAAPSVPHRNGVTVRVKTDGGDGGEDAKSAKGSHTPSGSHRVLLKLRRMSGGGGGSTSRPKSVSDASEIPGSGAAESPGNASEKPGHVGVRMRGSRSMHQMFHYNKTWNERSLSKCLREEGGQHNYENIYSGDKDANNEESADFNPLYENVAYHQYQYPFVSLGNPLGDEGGSLVIGQLTKSPRSTARSRKKPIQNPSNSNSGSNNNGLFRSKSCERPKMRDAVRETQQHLVSNFNRLLQNKFGVGSSNNNNNNSSNSALTTSASMFMGGDGSNSSGYKSFHSGADDLHPQVRIVISRDGLNGRKSSVG